MPLASLELFDSDSEEPPPKKRRRGELELLTSGAGYFAIPIVKSRRYNLRPRKLQSKNMNTNTSSEEPRSPPKRSMRRLRPCAAIERSVPLNLQNE